MRLRRVRYVGFVILWAFAFAMPCWSAQKPATTPPASPAAAAKGPATKAPAGAPAEAQVPPAEEVAAAPPVITVTDVIPSSERALLRLREIRNALNTDMSISEVEAGLAQLAQHSEAWWQGETAAIRQVHSVQRINDVTWQLHLYQGQVTAWSSLLTASTKKWSEEEETLDSLIAEWQATQASLDETTPAEVGTKVADVLLDGEAVRDLFQEKTAQLVAVQGKLAARLARLNEIGEEIDSVRLPSAASLLTLDSPPLWTRLLAGESEPSSFAQIRDGAVKIYRDVLSFYGLYRMRLFVHLALILLLLALFFRLSHQSQKPDQVMPTDAERYILDRSVASALLVALLLVPLIYYDSSPQMLRLLLLPEVIPLLMLLPAIFSPQLRIAFYILTVLYLFEFWRGYLPPQYGLIRIWLLLEAGLGVAVFYQLHKVTTSGPLASPSRKSVVQASIKIGMGLFLGALIANLVGAFTLAEVLLSPVIRILYLGVVIRLATVVATTFVMMALRAPLALMFRTVQQRGSAVAEKIRHLLNIAALGLWLFIAMFNIGALGLIRRAVSNIFEAQLKMGAVEIPIRDVVTFILVFGIAFVLSRVLRFLLANEIFPRFHMPRGVPDALELLARYGVLLFGFLLALISAGVNLSQLTLALSALGVGIGFGLQNIVNNFVCGLILVFEHPIQVGDFVEVGTHFGQVKRIGFRSSSLNTLDGGNVIIPNSELIGNKVMNWSLSNQLRRITLRVPVPFGTEPNRVIDMFQAIARSQPDVVTYPVPSAALETINDGSLRFILRCWTRTEKFEAVSFGLVLGINNAFKDAGIPMAIAQSDVHLHWTEKPGAELAPGEKSKLT